MYDKLCDNLNLLMKEAHVSADELARRTGVPASTIKKIRNRYNPNPTLSTLLPLANYFCITLDQLTGVHPFNKIRQQGQYQQADSTLQKLPIITWEESISWSSLNCSKDKQIILSENKYSENAFALIVENEDWENLMNNTILLIEPNIKHEHRDFVLVYHNNHIIPVLKQILHDENTIYLKSINYGKNIIPFTQDHKLLGVVIEYKKYLKKRGV